MSVATIPAYITTVRPDRTIVLPEEMIVGAAVAVVALPTKAEQDDTARQVRFETTLNAINNASAVGNDAPISDEQLNVLIRKARRSSTT